MALFAKLNNQNVVIEVNVVNDSDVNYLEFPASEPVGIAFLTNWSGGYSNWKQTSDLSKYRKHYGGPGFIYDETLDAFIPPKPFESWVFNADRCVWEPPVAYPDDGKYYMWDEATVNWKEVS
jgi:hypothetical protein